MVLGVGFLLLTSLIISAALAAIGTYMEGNLPGGATLWQIITFAVSFAITTLLFALIFKYVPDAKIAWRDVWIGAAFTAFLFVLGKFGIGFYLGRSSVASTYGAAASVIIIILWLYYSGLILFFGSEFTEACWGWWHRDRDPRWRRWGGDRRREERDENLPLSRRPRCTRVILRGCEPIAEYEPCVGALRGKQQPEVPVPAGRHRAPVFGVLIARRYRG